MNDRFLKLTNSLYKLLEFFPESDPLKNRAKDRALAIMDNLVLINQDSGWVSFQKEKTKALLLEDIDILLGYLWVAKSQGWLNSINCLIIANEYEKIKKEMCPVIDLAKNIPLVEKLDLIEEKIESKEASISVIEDTAAEEGAPVSLPEKSVKLSDRQGKIVDFLSKNEKAQVMDLQKILSDVTKRTIRRDLDELLELGKIVRHGDFNQVFYKINNG